MSSEIHLADLIGQLWRSDASVKNTPLDPAARTLVQGEILKRTGLPAKDFQDYANNGAAFDRRTAEWVGKRAPGNPMAQVEGYDYGHAEVARQIALLHDAGLTGRLLSDLARRFAGVLEAKGLADAVAMPSTRGPVGCRQTDRAGPLSAKPGTAPLAMPEADDLLAYLTWLANPPCPLLPVPHPQLLEVAKYAAAQEYERKVSLGLDRFARGGISDLLPKLEAKYYSEIDPDHDKAVAQVQEAVDSEIARVRKEADLLLVSVKGPLLELSELASALSEARAWNAYQMAVHQADPNALARAIQDLERVKAKMERATQTAATVQAAPPAAAVQGSSVPKPTGEPAASADRNATLEDGGAGQPTGRKRRKRGAKPSRNANKDKRVYEARQKGLSYRELAREFFGDESETREVALAIDSRRHKLRRMGQK